MRLWRAPLSQLLAFLQTHPLFLTTTTTCSSFILAPRTTTTITTTYPPIQICSEDAGDAALAFTEGLIREQYRKQILKRLAKEARALSDDARAAKADAELAELDVRPTTDAVAQMHAHCDRAIAAALADAGGSAAELEAREARLRAGAAADARLVANVRGVDRRTRRALAARERGFHALFDSVQRTVSAMFMNYMMRRKHQGKVRLYEDAGELKLLVKMNQAAAAKDGADGAAGGAAGGSAAAAAAAAGGGRRARADRAVSDLKQLSGGERSYTTVAFMLALGEYVEAPFRCMDEYDVVRCWTMGLPLVAFFVLVLMACLLLIGGWVAFFAFLHGAHLPPNCQHPTNCLDRNTTQHNTTQRRHAPKNSSWTRSTAASRPRRCCASRSRRAPCSTSS